MHLVHLFGALLMVVVLRVIPVLRGGNLLSQCTSDSLPKDGDNLVRLNMHTCSYDLHQGQTYHIISALEQRLGYAVYEHLHVIQMYLLLYLNL